MKILLVILAVPFIWALISKPGYVAAFLFTLIIADINLDVPGLPLNLRAIVSICLFGRIIFKKQDGGHPPFILAYSSFLIIVFFLYYLFTTWANDLLDFALFKELVTNFISAYCAYYFFFENNNTNLLKLGLVLGGLICVADLTYTYKVVGAFPVVRIIDVYTGKVGTSEFIQYNHNFFAYVCGLCFIFFFSEFMRGRIKNNLILLVMPVMLLGILMSTGRTSLLVTIIVSLLVMIDSFRSSKEGAKRVSKFILTGVMAAFIGILAFQTFNMMFSLNKELTDNITSRLIDEPVAVFRKHLGYNYNASALGPMEWREEASDIAYNAFMGLEPREQIFGIGAKGFYARNFGYGLNAHNGYLLLLIEGGIVGFLIFGVLIFLLFRRASFFKLKSSASITLIFILLFTVGNNNEMTSAKAFLIIGTLIAEIEYASNRFRSA